MSLLLPDSDLGMLRADAPELNRKLREGDGIQWSGDPTLHLAQGVVEEVKWGRPTGNIVARRWEVWRHCEDGVDRMIGHWRMEEFDRILFDMARMRAEAPGHIDVVDAIDAANEVNDKRIWAKGKDSMTEMMEHMLKLHHDTTEGKSTFRGMPGMNPDKQL